MLLAICKEYGDVARGFRGQGCGQDVHELDGNGGMQKSTLRARRLLQQDTQSACQNALRLRLQEAHGAGESETRAIQKT